MLVYRAAEENVDPRALLEQLEDTLAALRRDLGDAETWTALLLQTGELEAAVVDAHAGDVDEERSLDRLVRALSVRAASGIVVLERGGRPPDEWSDTLDAGVALVRQRELPAMVTRRVPEGYAYYALYPGMYARAAADFLSACAPRAVTVVGIRSIGTSLSAVVHAALAAHGCRVSSFTVRPHGHPFDRIVQLGPELQRRIRAARDDWFAIVDEGPGLSGSSFSAAAESLAALGVPHERIVFFPSWIPDAARLCNRRARECWSGHAKFTSTFEQVWLETGRLSAAWGATSLRDWSAGRWRSDLGFPEGCRPPVNPQHERRKYRVDTPDGELVLKFVGLGRHGVARLRIATRLADLGFAPEVLGLRHGFLGTRFVNGVPLDARSLERHDLERIGAYIAARPLVPTESAAKRLRELEHVADVNTAEALGDTAARELAGMRLAGEVRASVHAVAVDGRMQAHEWIRSGTRLMKTDGVTHWDDHFQPGPQDAAWDLAGAAIELQLDDASLAAVARAYVAATGDASIAERLPFYRAAYLACRLGYASLCRDSLGDTDDGRRFGALAAEYRDRLARAVSKADAFAA